MFLYNVFNDFLTWIFLTNIRCSEKNSCGKWVKNKTPNFTKKNTFFLSTEILLLEKLDRKLCYSIWIQLSFYTISMFVLKNNLEKKYCTISTLSVSPIVTARLELPLWLKFVKRSDISKYFSKIYIAISMLQIF